VADSNDRSAAMRRVAAAIAAWTDGRSRAVLLGGSHAAGHAVWRASGGVRVPLSDLDLYVVVPDRAVQARARRRMRDHAPALDLGDLASGIEVAFLTPADLAALPARPGTL
jgi:predicted nucleotidyltransferase